MFCTVEPAVCALVAGALYGAVASTVYAVSGSKAKSKSIARPVARARREFPFEVRLQAQGGGTEKSVKIHSFESITGVEGLQGLEMLKGTLDRKEYTIRLSSFTCAERFISGTAAGGGTYKGRSCPIAWRNPIRVDVNVERGLNFVPGLTSGAVFDVTIGTPR